MTTEELAKESFFRPATVLAKAPVRDLYESVLSLYEEALPSDKDWAKAQREDAWCRHTIRW
jgi:hypothetical protein